MKNKTYEIIISKTIQQSDIENIITTALEGGIGYWACLINEGRDFDEGYENDLSTSEIVSKILLNGGSVKLYDAEMGIDDAEPWELTLLKVIEGLKLYYLNTNARDLGDIDADDADAIIQYAIFGQLIFG